MTKVFEILFNIRRDELLKVLLMFAYQFLLIAAVFVVGRTVANTLFLKEIDRKYIPWTYVMATAGVTVAIIIYRRISGRWDRIRQIVLSFLVFALLSMVARLLLILLPKSFILLAAVFVVIEIMVSLGVFQFWLLANEIFTSRQARRVFGFIATGGIVSSVAFGIFLRASAKQFGTENLLFIMAGLLVLACVIVAWVGKLFYMESVQSSHLPASSRERSESSLLNDMKLVAGSKALLSIASVVLITVVVANIVDYQWKVSVQNSYRDNKEAMAGYFGTFYIISGLSALLFQYVIARKLFDRYGILVRLLLLPVALLLSSATILFWPLALGILVPATIAKTGDSTFRYTANDTGIQILYLPLGSELKARAKAVIDGLLRPIFIGGTGLLILLLSTILDGKTFSLVVIILVAIWLLLAFAAKSGYFKALSTSISRKKLDLDGSRIPYDESAVSALKHALESDNPTVQSNTLDLISSIPEVDWNPILLGLLKSPDNEVYTKALRLIARSENSTYSDELRKHIRSTDMERKAEAIIAFAAVAGINAEADLLPLLSDENALVRGAAISSLVNHGSTKSVDRILEILKKMVISENPEERKLTARVLGDCTNEECIHMLYPLILDDNIEVSIEAIKSAGRKRSPILLQPIIEAARAVGKSSAAISALMKFDAKIIPELAGLMHSSGADLRVKKLIPAIIAAIDPGSAGPFLIEAAVDVSPEVRNASIEEIGKTLSVADSKSADTVKEVIKSELSGFFKSAACLARLFQESDSDSLLKSSLKDRCRDTSRNIIFLLKALNPSLDIDVVLAGLDSSSPAVKSNALELLDGAVKIEDKKVVLAAFENLPVRKKVEIGKKFVGALSSASEKEMLEILTRDDNPWICACAARHAASAGFREISDISRERGDVLRFMEGDGMLSIIEKVMFLKSIDLFARIPGDSLAVIAGIAGEVTSLPGDLILKEGAQGSDLFLIIRGKVSVVSEGREVAVLGETDFFGEMSLLDSEPCSATVKSLEETDLLKIRQEDFYELVRQRPEISKGIIKALTYRLRETNKKLASIIP